MNSNLANAQPTRRHGPCPLRHWWRGPTRLEQDASPVVVLVVLFVVVVVVVVALVLVVFFSFQCHLGSLTFVRRRKDQ